MPDLEPNSLIEPEVTEKVIDLSAYFEDLGEGPASCGRPLDYPGVEILTILHTYGRSTAGKQYRPDPSGERRAVTASDYNIGSEFIPAYAVIGCLDDVFGLLQSLSTDPTAFLVRGMPDEPAGRRLRRRSPPRDIAELINRRMHEHHGDGDIEEVPRQLQMLDLDGVPLPPKMSVIDDPEACVTWAVDNLLPPEFHDVSFVYQLSSSAGLTKAPNQLNVHLWFFTDRPLWNVELRNWAKWWNAKQEKKIVDGAVFNPVQPHYTNNPVLLGGLVDPLAGRRLGLARGQRLTVPLRLPTDAELVEEGRLRQRRARAIISRGTGADEASNQPLPNPAEDTQNDAAEPDYDDIGFTTRGKIAGAVRGSSPGWRGYLDCIGFEGSIRDQIRAAIGSYFREHGSRAERRVLVAEIERAIEESKFLDCGAPYSRPRSDARDYLQAPQGGISNVDEMIRDFAQYQAESERRGEEACEPSWPTPQLTADQAFDQISKAISEAILGACELRLRLLGLIGDPMDAKPLFTLCSRTAVLCEPGVGKTEAMLNSVITTLRLDPGMRVAIAVPTHALGRGLAVRINERFGAKVAAEWYGTDQEDPQHQGENIKMCRLADAADALRTAGGDVFLLCGSRKRGYCPHHPAVAGKAGCGYRRQQFLANRASVRVWIVPASMLSMAPPDAFQRSGNFDLLVIDEAPWFGLLRGFDEKPEELPVDWLASGWWKDQKSPHAESERAFAIGTLAKIYAVLAGQPLGEVIADTFFEVGISAEDVKRTRQFVWSCKIDLREFVAPGLGRDDLERALSKVAPINKRVKAVAEALQVMRTLLQGQLAPSGFELIECKHGGRSVRLRWRNEINAEWLRSTPVLYLDAAGTGGAELAKAWLPDLNVAVEARATAPHMRVTQITDTQMGYRRVCSTKSDESSVPKPVVEKLARVIATRAPPGLLICPKTLQEEWEAAERLPGWDIWHFNAFRGRDEARNARQLVVVSRPLPSPADAERVAEAIFGRRVKRLKPGEFYPLQPVGRLMADGSGRRALAFRHPDPDVEANRFAICEGELLQAVGRGRGVRRTAETPLDVLILTNVPIPVPVNELSTWTNLSDDAGPIEVLAARGVVPLDYEGIASALPDGFKDAAAATEWFRDRAAAKKRLKRLRVRAECGGSFFAGEFLGNPHKNTPMDNSQKLIAYRHHRKGVRQSNLVLVDPAMHEDARAAAVAVLGPVEEFEAVAASNVKVASVKPKTMAERLALRHKSDHGMRPSGTT